MKEMERYAKENHVPIMKEDGIQFVQEILQKYSYVQHILEIGTAIGYSAICMANVRWDIVVDTFEIDPERFQVAKENIARCHLEERIHPYLMDAILFFPKKRYDLIFVDGPKAQYQRYVEHFLPWMVKGSIFIFDNLNFHGFVDDPSKTKNRSTIQMMRKLHTFRERLLHDPRFDTIFMDHIGDGIAVSIVR